MTRVGAYFRSDSSSPHFSPGGYGFSLSIANIEVYGFVQKTVCLGNAYPGEKCGLGVKDKC